MILQEQDKEYLAKSSKLAAHQLYEGLKYISFTYEKFLNALSDVKEIRDISLPALVKELEELMEKEKELSSLNQALLLCIINTAKMLIGGSDVRN